MKPLKAQILNGEIMKWFRCAHPPIFTASLAPLFMTDWDLWLRLLLPLAALTAYALNEVVLHRREKAARTRAIELDREHPLVHAYREPHA